MYKGKKIIAIIPARGGSKGIKLKNLLKINNKSLIQITTEVLREVKYIDKIILSSDHESIIKEGKKSGLEVPFIRPKKISGDKVGDTPVILHSIKHFEKMNQVFDIILLIQVTSPLRKAKHITKCIEKLVNNNYDSVFTVSKVNEKYHPLKQFILKDDKIKYFHKDGKKIIRRQDLNNSYIRNGICYAFTKECIKIQKDKIGRNASYVLIEEDFVNIDNISDLDNFKFKHYG